MKTFKLFLVFLLTCVGNGLVVASVSVDALVDSIKNRTLVTDSDGSLWQIYDT